MMKGFVKAVICMGFAASVSLAAPATAQEFQVPVTSSFTEGEIQFTGGFGPVYYFMWNATAVEGRVAICGTGYLRDPRLRSTIRDMARDGEFMVGGRVYPIDLRFFSRSRTQNSMASDTANCLVTEAPVPSSGGVRLSFSSGTFRN